eukprot:TRINITY_DN66643_c0_g1_i1.p1 TRINITY_DN66643_c0_g1~~TRINITY_DN66643_c0_g1_i1.p1  ORF type:complete len:397 (+),score=54.36 TRINITY_DN66643_c0_g1_i1:1-1191(+)
MKQYVKQSMSVQMTAQHLQPGQATFIFLLLSALAVARCGCSQSKKICGAGYYQKDPVTIDCDGGKGRKSMVTSQGEAFTWQAPRGTVDLVIEAFCEPLKSRNGSAEMSVKCDGKNGQTLLGETGKLNEQVRQANIQGANWTWSGMPDPESHNGSFKIWIRVRGKLYCDTELLVANSHVAPLAVDLQYSWSGIDPCPLKLKGCAHCPDKVCHDDEQAVCDGSAYWECIPRVVLQASTSHAAPAPPSGTNSGQRASALRPELQFAPPPAAEASQREVSRASPAEAPLDLPSAPIPTTHPAVTLLRWPMRETHFAQQPRVSPPLRRKGHESTPSWSSTASAVIVGMAAVMGAGMVAALCVVSLSGSSTTPLTSPEARAGLGPLIETGQRGQYEPVGSAA